MTNGKQKKKKKNCFSVCTKSGKHTLLSAEERREKNLELGPKSRCGSLRSHEASLLRKANIDCSQVLEMFKAKYLKFRPNAGLGETLLVSDI